MLLKRTIFAWASLAALQYLPGANAEGDHRPTATIDAGVVIGTTTALPVANAVVNKFLGIPFAKSPPKRFTPAEKPEPWTKPRDASTWSPACIQQFVCRFLSPSKAR